MTGTEMLIHRGEQTGPASEPRKALSRAQGARVPETLSPGFSRGSRHPHAGVSLSGVTLEEEVGPRAGTFGGADVFRSPPQDAALQQATRVPTSCRLSWVS